MSNLAVTSVSEAPFRAGSWVGKIAHYLALAFQLGLFLIVVDQFNIESRAFLHLGILTFFGWSIHFFLPLRYRMPFFALLSLIGIELVFGFQKEQWSAEGLVSGAWIIAIGMGLIGICRLRLSFALRIGLLAGAGAVLAFGRAGEISFPWSAAILPVVASMFMFRLIVYMYQDRHDKKRASLIETIGYFFMLPNVVFPLFPVVDYQTFRRSHYAAADRYQTYQTGIHWLFRGAIHLILYRLVYQNFVIDAVDVTNQAELLQYLLWPFLLYFRVSGTFHIIIGLLYLFGFKLPETHKLYFLSSSFNDFWRRINIYWKDFIMKVVYYPVYFKMKVWGETTALVIATLIAFLLTWLLHAYQWYWLRGTWLLTWNDGLFWAVLATLVIGNSLYEIKFGRRRRLSGQSLNWRETVPSAVRTVGVFATISILWSFWTAPSVSEWLGAWSAIARPAGEGWNALLMLFVVIAAISVPSMVLARGLADRQFNFAKSAVSVTATALLLIALSFEQVQTSFGPTVRDVMASVKMSELNRVDFANMERGYYENLQNVGGFNSKLWEVYRTRPKDWIPLRNRSVARELEGLPEYELLPNIETSDKGGNLTTNRWGMRDRDFEKARPANTIRIAFVGASFVFGSGVHQDQTLKAVLEKRLNQQREGQRSPEYQVLNFAMPAYSAIERLITFESKVIQFELNYLFYFEHRNSARQGIPKIAKALLKKFDHDYEFLHAAYRKAGIDESNIDKSADRSELVRKLIPYSEEILAGIYRRMIEVSRQKGIVPVWIYWPRPEHFEGRKAPEPEVTLAREAGFTILDLSGAYGDQDLGKIWIARWDHHPNAQGQRMIADKLYKALREAEDEIHLGLDGGAATTVSATNPSIDKQETP